MISFKDMKKKDFDWKKKKILVTGGASFIGSHLVDKLVLLGASVIVIDDLSSGKKENIQDHIKNKRIEFIKGDLRDQKNTRRSVKGIDLLIHLAGDHGGRGYIDLHQAGPASNFLVDGMVFWETLRAGVEKVVFASSGCIYPKYLQNDINKKFYLTEKMAGPPYDADNMYGWAKLMGEFTLQSYYKEYGLKAAICRFFTVYGPRGKEDHGVMAMIAKAFIKQDPYEVWGDGKQVRNWTYVDDIVNGVILASERLDDGRAINLGTMERVRVIDAALEVLRYTSYKAKIKLMPNMPTGPMNRVADNSLAKRLLGWKPKVKFTDGLHKTIDWYFSTHNQDQVSKKLYTTLTER